MESCNISFWEKRMIAKIIYFLTLTLLVSSSCKKEKKRDLEVSDVVGTWDVSQLIIDWKDTTEAMKRDSACFSSLVFYDFDDATGRVETMPAPNMPDSLFRCFCIGDWFIAGSLIIDMHGFCEMTGPYLYDHPINWTIVEFEQTKLKLYNKFNDLDCYLILRKR